jgi:hypothetical protein
MPHRPRTQRRFRACQWSAILNTFGAFDRASRVDPKGYCVRTKQWHKDQGVVEAK